MRTPSPLGHPLGMVPTNLPRRRQRVAHRGRSISNAHGRHGASILAVFALTLLVACGGNDDDVGATTSVAADETTVETPDAESAGDEAADPATVESCLADAGFTMTVGTDQLSEQQLADLLTQFGQTESLTFDAATNSFAGGVSFFETAAQASERAEQLADLAKAQRVIGAALINISAGSDFEDAVAAAEACLTA